MKKSFLFLFAATAFAGCTSDCVVGTGQPELRNVAVAPFTSIEVEGAIDVVIEKGDSQLVVVEAPLALIPLLKTEVQNGIWTIATSTCWTSMNGFTIHITTPLINKIQLEGSGSATAADVFGAGDIQLSTTGSGAITLKSVVAKKIAVESEGSGSITISGTCADLSASLSGSGDFNGKDLTANTADITTEGSGNASITAITTLNANVEGSGTIHYAGKPDVSSSVDGSGAVIPME
ncbi:MAG: DUF2807 domain-containing protein [Flavobacteriales bacterium]|nr:DUF2807 domain-containing protein [Flavobacteriales bacterium]